MSNPTPQSFFNDATRAQLDKILREDKIVEVTFTKVDGTVRAMPCTLNEGLIPPAPAPDLTKPPRVKKHNPAVMSVFCTDKQEWRSFRLENVISFKVVE
jgi:hypothetical protein